MKETFSKLSASEQLAREISDEIRRGTWAAGTKLPSMRKLASRYGVGLSTVHKAIAELDRQKLISRNSAQRGVVPAGEAESEAKRDQIGVIAGFDPNVQVPLWWQNAIVHSAQVSLLESGYRLSHFNYLHAGPDPVQQVVDAMSGSLHSLAGMLVFLMPGVNRMVDHLDEINLPWMTINPMDTQTHYNYVMADNLAGGRTVGRCFVRLGYDRIAVLYSELDEVSPLEKVSGLYQAYLEKGITPSQIQLVRSANHEEQSAYAAMREYLSAGGNPQAVFAISDPLALGAIRACRDAGLDVPGDVGVVGSTGFPVEYLPVDLSLAELRQPVEEMGRQISLCLQEMIRGGLRRISGRRIHSPFIVRDSLRVPEAIQRELGLGRYAADMQVDSFEISQENAVP